MNASLVGLSTIAKEWDDLAEQGSNHDIFQLREWLELWWKNYGMGKQEKVIISKNEHNLIEAIAPFYYKNVIFKNKIKLFKVLRLIGSGECSYSGFIFSQYEQSPLCGIWNYLGKKFPGFIVELRDIPEEQFQVIRKSIGKGYHFKAEKGSVCPRIIFGATWDEYWKTLGESTKKNAKWYRNRFAREQSFSIERIQSFDIYAIKDLFELHYSRWGMDPNTIELQRLEHYETEIAQMLSDKKYLSLWFLNFEGKRIAAMYTYDYNGTRYYHKGGYDINYKAYSPGSVLLFHTIKHAFEEGIKVYDFLRGDEAYKKLFSNSFRQNWNVVAGSSMLKVAAFRLLMQNKKIRQ